MTDPYPAYRSAAAIALFAIAFALLLTADLVSKQTSFDRLMIAQSGTPPARVDIDSHTYELLPNLLHLRLTANQGAVFGIGQGKRWFFVMVSVGAIAFLIYLFATTRRNQWPTQLLLAALLAGVVGNMYDRLTIGYVRDMLWMLPNWKWADVAPFLPAMLGRFEIFPWIFNFADSYLVLGVGIVIVYMLFIKKEPHPAVEHNPVASSP